MQTFRAANWGLTRDVYLARVLNITMVKRLRNNLSFVTNDAGKWGPTSMSIPTAENSFSDNLGAGCVVADTVPKGPYDRVGELNKRNNCCSAHRKQVPSGRATAQRWPQPKTL